MRMLANKDIRLTYYTGWVLNTDYKVTATQDSAEVLLASATNVAALLLHNLVALRDFVLGATGEETINDPPLALIGASETVAGATSYDGSQMRSYRNTVAGDDLWGVFLKGVTGSLVKRIGTLSTTAYANNDKVQLFNVSFGTPIHDHPAGGGWWTALHKVHVAEAWEHSVVKTAFT